MSSANRSVDTRVSESDKSVSRRKFLAATGVAASIAVVQPKSVRGSQANSKITLGMIGCGGRGSWIANLFQQHGGYELIAVADYFSDRSQSLGDRSGVPANRRYSGLSGYLRLLESGVDAVAIETPPYFHPAQVAAAVAAGSHVYLAKPLAVDVPGCHKIAECGKRATANQLCCLVDFQTRTDPFFIEALRRVHQGLLGTFAFGEATYHAGDPFGQHHRAWQEQSDNAEVRLRGWGLDRELSGDIITEQNIHTLDVMSWIMNQEPLYAEGACGRSVRTVGTCADHFTIRFQYPNDISILFSSRQFDAFGTQPEGIRNRMFGTTGVLETEYGGEVAIRGPQSVAYAGGKSPGIYTDGAVANIAAFHRDIVDANYGNPTVEPSVRSNLVTILGREAAYAQERVAWDVLVRCDKEVEPNLTGLKS